MAHNHKTIQTNQGPQKREVANWGTLKGYIYISFFRNLAFG